MKTILTLFVLAMLAVVRAADPSSEPGKASTNQPSQVNQLNLPLGLPSEKVRDMMRFQTTTVARVLGVDFEVDGVLPRVLQADHPLHLLNPLAPADYGTGFENLSLNPRTHQIEGISFLTFRF